MHVYFSGIGGAGIGPQAILAQQAGYKVSGSDSADSSYIEYLREHGIDDVHIGQSSEQIAEAHAKEPIDWFVYSAALPLTDPDHPELKFCKANGIKNSNRSEFTNQIIKDKNLQVIAVAGTHGKSTATAMAVWLFQQLGVPISYLVGAKLNFADSAHYEPGSRLFIYEADEYHHNFLNFHPQTSLISGIDWDHPDFYPTREEYYQAFRDFINQSKHTALWREDARRLELKSNNSLTILDEHEPAIDRSLMMLKGRVNRLNAWLVANELKNMVGSKPFADILGVLNQFPGLSRRFEKITMGLYTDYAHTPAKIRGALQTAQETGGNNVVVVYEGLHNTRQHFIKAELANLFDDVKQLYIVPSFLAREDKTLELLTPTKLLNMLSNKSKNHAVAAEKDQALKDKIQQHIAEGDLVLALSAGGAGSLDEWLRQEFKA